MYEKSKYVTTASPAQKDFLASQHGEKKNLEVILNCPDVSLFNPENIDEYLKETLGENVLIHIGYIGKEYGADILVRSMSLIKKEIKDVKLLFLGKCLDKNFMDYLKKLIEKLNLKKNIIFDRVPYNRVPHYLNASKIGFIAFRDRFYNHVGGANKLFEYMACGLGIVSSEMFGFKKLVKDGRNVLFAKPESPEDFADKTIILLNDKKLYNEMRRQNIKISRKKYNWAIQEEKIKKILEYLKNS